MRRIAAKRWCLLVAVLLPVALHAAPPVAEWLAEAEAVRSAQPARLAALLVDLDAAAGSATPAQREQIAYLHAYSDAYAGRYASALADARNIVETTQSPDMRKRARALIVTIHGLSRHFAEGLRELEALHAGLEQIEDQDVRRIALFASAGLYRQVGQYALAIRDLDQFIEDTGPLSDRERCFATQLREEARQAAGQPPSAGTLQAIIDQCLAAGEPLVANMARLSLARGTELGGDAPAAIAMLRTWLPEIEATRYPRLVTDVHSALAEWLADAGDLAAAQRHAMRAVAEARDDRALLPLTTAHQVLYEIAVARDDLRAALHHYKRYAEADKAYLNDVKAREFAYQIVRRETQQQNQQIALLDQQNQVLTLRQKVNEQAAQNTRLLIALLLVLLASIAFWAWRVGRRHHSLRHLAEIDSLTGACNRRYFLVQAEQCLQQCARTNDTVALVMFDLDHFKQINDNHGHVTGDWVLEQVAESCRPLCRRVDKFGRLGGEEFALLLPGCDSDAAARVAEQCRRKIASIDTSGSGQAFPLTASFGVTDTMRSGYVVGRLLSHADQALYLAKDGGRNMVCVFTGEQDRPASVGQVSPGVASQRS
ncbi:MAG TPA: GGDEF domain-containing protein [Xanthomonadaceae bacterium]|nr:GGDEF domain-containing protein [Xanthomonadaceae bacterium]